MRYPPPLGRLAAAAGGVSAALRRRREQRKPRVRVRIAHGEATVLAEGSPEQERLLALAGELTAEYGKLPRGER
jgi:hypothetical protein